MIRASFVSLSLNMQKYGWSKWGGPRKGIVKESLDTWYCQVCAEQQTIGLPAYMVHIGDRDYIRLCSKCWSKVQDGWELSRIKISIRHGMWVDNLDDN